MPKSEKQYWDYKLETQTRADWDSLKLQLFISHLKHAYEGSPYYRKIYDAAHLHSDKVKSLNDLKHFPTILKSILRERQEAVAPFGDIIAVPALAIIVTKQM